MQEAKDAGAAYFKAKQFDKAVESYTVAIDAAPADEKEVIAVLYSNRSGAHAAQGTDAAYKKALLDANKAIELRPAWGKGYSRRGTAYEGLRNWVAARGAYEEGLKVEPENANMKAAHAQLVARLSGGSDPSRAGAARPPAATTPGASGGGSTTIPGLVPLLNLGVLVCAVAYVFVGPLLGPRRAQGAYMLSLGCAFSTFLLAIRAKFPLFRAPLTTLRDPNFGTAHETQYLILTLLLQLSPPVPFVLAPFAAYAVHAVCNAYGGAIAYLPSFARGVVEPRVAFLRTEEGGQAVLAFAALSEVMVGAFLPFLAFVHGAKMAMLTLFFWRYLARRHAASFWTKQAVDILVERVRDLGKHRFVPAPVGGLLDAVVSTLSKVFAKLR